MDAATLREYAMLIQEFYDANKHLSSDSVEMRLLLAHIRLIGDRRPANPVSRSSPTVADIDSALATFCKIGGG